MNEELIEKFQGLEICLYLVLGELYVNNPDIYEKIKIAFHQKKEIKINLPDDRKINLLPENVIHYFDVICKSLEKNHE